MSEDIPVFTIKEQTQTVVPVTTDTTLVDDPVALVDSPTVLSGGPTTPIEGLKVSILEPAPRSSIKISR